MNTASKKFHLSEFLDQVFAHLGPQAATSSAEELQMMLAASRAGAYPDTLASRMLTRRAARVERNYNVYLANVKDALRNHAYSTEREVQVLAEDIVAAVKTHGSVSGLLHFSQRSQRLPELNAKLNVYNEFVFLLHMLQELTDSAKLAIETARIDAVNRLVDLRDVPDSSEQLGTSEALKSVIKILDNSL